MLGSHRDWLLRKRKKFGSILPEQKKVLVNKMVQGVAVLIIGLRIGLGLGLELGLGLVPLRQ